MVKALRLDITVTPNARRSEVVSRDGNVWRVRVAAKPVGGAANAALIALVAEALGVAKSMVSITRGARSRRKVVAVDRGQGFG